MADGTRMFLERRMVSRKTPGDGKLEISMAAAKRLQDVGTTIEVELGSRRAPARVETMACACQKVGSAHEHHFVMSDLLRSLRSETQVDLHLDVSDGERPCISVAPVAS